MKNSHYLLWLLFPWLMEAQEEIIHRFAPVSITASRLTSSMAAETRQLDILSAEEMMRLPAATVPEMLQYVNGIDMQQRSPDGIQADFSMRGCGFEQVLILLDGVRLNDPQTGHHNADIPVSLSDVDRIEILHGHASSMYGPEGYGGVINIITRNTGPAESTVSAGIGSFGAMRIQCAQSLKIGGFSSRWRFERAKSDGYRPVTDNQMTSLTHLSRWKSGRHALQMTGGLTVKDFGANGFYGEYPSREKTRMRMGIVSHEYRGAPFQWNTHASIRLHDDLFILDQDRPGWYRNDHHSRSAGLESSLQVYLFRNVQMAAGMEFLDERLKSSNLGNRAQQRAGFFIETVWPFEKRGVINSGIRLDYHEAWGLEVSPSLNMMVKIDESLKWRAASGRIFRAPTFTELYYQSPSNTGNPDLKPEHGWNLETGLDKVMHGMNAGITIFHRNEQDRIDWITDRMTDPWRAVNLGDLKSSGISLSSSSDPGRTVSWTGDYTWLDQSGNPNPYFSKYQYNILRHQFNMGWFLKGPLGISQSWNAAWKKRRTGSAYWLMSVKWIRNFGKVRLFVEGRNLLGTPYEEITGVPMPGRHYAAGADFVWKDE